MCLCFPIRYWHNSPALTWSTPVAASAQNWSSTCVYEHDPNNSYGENLYIGWSSSGMAVATALNKSATAWYNEVAYYNYADPANPTASGQATGQ